MLWADSKGSAFFALEGETGVLGRIAFPSFELQQERDLERKFSWMSLSHEGLLFSQPDAEEIWVVDPISLGVKTRIPVPRLKRAVSAPNLELAIACDAPDDRNLTQHLYVVDLGKKAVERYEGPGGSDNPALTPDGTYLFTQGGQAHGQLRNRLCRFAFREGKLAFEEEIERRGVDGRFQMGDHTPDNSAGITISDDSKYVCLVVPWTPTPIYHVDSFSKTLCTLEPGPRAGYVDGRRGPPMYPPLAIGFDLKGGTIYGQSGNQELLVCNAAGVIKKRYKVGVGSIKQFLVHPMGHQVLLLRGELTRSEVADPRLPLMSSDTEFIELPKQR
jgi:hypothetical protein